jgi:hypothetical protein
MAQLPLVQVDAALASMQTLAHAPQLLGSVSTSVSHPSMGVSLQSLNPGLQLAMPQLPAVHLGTPLALEHILEHAPQLFGSVSMSTSHPFEISPSQSRNPAVQAMPQWSVVHVGVAWGAWGHMLPHIPQLFGSVSRLVTHPLPPQAAKPGLHAGEPEEDPLEPAAAPLEPAALEPDPAPLEPDPVPLEPEATAPEPEIMPLDPEAAPLEPDGCALTPALAPVVAPLEPEVSPLVPTTLEPDDMSFADPSSDSTEMLEPPHAASESAKTHSLPPPTGLLTATVLSAPKPSPDPSIGPKHRTLWDLETSGRYRRRRAPLLLVRHRPGHSGPGANRLGDHGLGGAVVALGVASLSAAANGA